MSGQSTGMQMENLVDALLSDERVLTASERALLASIVQIATSPTDSPQIDALVTSRVMAAIGTSVFQRALGILNQVFAQRLIAPSIPPPQTNVGPNTPVASSQAPPKSPTVPGVDPLRPALPPFVIPFFPLPPFIFNPPPPPPLPPIPPPLDPPPPIELPPFGGIPFQPIVIDPPTVPTPPPLPPDPPAPANPPLPPDPPAPTGTDTDTDTGTDIDTDTDTDADGGDLDGGDGDGGGCYVTGTPVHLGDRSLRSIEQINAGDSVLTVDAKGRIEMAGVLKRTTYTAPETVQITFTSGDSVEVTPRHRFVASGSNLVRAKDLLKGDKVSSISGSPAEVLKVAFLKRPTEVHNLKLRQADRFFASKGGILGHVRKN
jgi:Pretoxin HINT domain